MVGKDDEYDTSRVGTGGVKPNREGEDDKLGLGFEAVDGIWKWYI